MTLKLNRSDAKAFIKTVNFKKAEGLVPVVVQDASDNKVLMQAFMNREALQMTLLSGKMYFWSRSRRKIWLKGSQSGHYSLVQNASLDCDNDAILFQVQQIGAICHTGQVSCFHKSFHTQENNVPDARIIERIYEIVRDRIENPTSKSYVSQLTAKGIDAILRKVGEETVELLLATKQGDRHAIIHEITDVLFHILVLMANKKYELDEIFIELKRRHQVKMGAFQQPSSLSEPEDTGN